MKFWRKDQKVISKINNNRLNFILAIIFLLGGLIIYKLFSLQVVNHDWYVALASSQHQIINQLEPRRGSIFYQDAVKNEPNGGQDSLYPAATNKNFAQIYAIPKDVKEADKIAEQLYIFFKKEMLEKEVDEIFKKQDEDRLKSELKAADNLSAEEKIIKQEEITRNFNLLVNDKTFMELRAVKREAEIKLRKEKIIADYLKILNKEGDPYEPLEAKVEEDILKNFYLALAPDANIKSEDLEIKNDQLIYHIYNQGEDATEQLTIAGLGFTVESFRFYPETNIGANLLGFVGMVGDEQKGRYGLEGFFETELAGQFGSLKAERDAGGNVIIINDRQYNKPQDGSDLILTISRSIQYTACQKLNEAILQHGADGGSVIIMEPQSGAILAMCSNPDFDPNNYNDVNDISVYNNIGVFAQYEPGSIYKVITMAASLDQEKITPQTTYNDDAPLKIADYTIENSDRQSHGVVNMTTVLEMSLNTGAIFAMRQIGPEIFTDYVKAFGFGEKTGIELEGEAKGDIAALTKATKKSKELYAATASFGQGIAVTPLQMATAFAAIANGGNLVKPYVVKEMVKIDGTKIKTEPTIIRRVISEKTATTLGAMMVNVVENGHGKKAGVKGYWVAGKTGTAQVPRKDGRGYQAGAHIGSFAGFAPVDDPRFVMVVRIDNPRDVEWAESSAAPLFGQIAEYMLNYWQVPKDR